MGDGMASVPEREMKHFMFRQMKRIRVFQSPDELPKDRVNLLVLSNIYGLVFMGGSSGLKILGSQYIVLADKEGGSINEIVEDAPFMSVNMKFPVHHIALSCDDFTLSVAMVSEEHGLVIAFFDVRTFLNKERSQKRPFAYYKPEKNCKVLDLKWNPTVVSILAICMSDGSVTILEVTDNIKQHASLPATDAITSLCWSPKGKQLAAGRQNGTVVQYSPVLQEKKVIPCPPFYNSDNPVKVLDVHWISTYVFAVVFVAADGSLETPPELVIISLAKKDEKKEDQFLNFNDLCFGVTTERRHHYYLHYIENWDILVASSAASIEVSVVARQQDKVNWEVWVLEDAARAELPVTESSDDTMPVGVGIDFTSQVPVRVGDEKIVAPSPILMLLTTEGLLCPFHMLNYIPGARSMVNPPQCPRIEGEREPQLPQTSVPAPSVLMPPQTSSSSPRHAARIVQPATAHPSPVFPPLVLPALPHFAKQTMPPQAAKTKPEAGLADGNNVETEAVVASTIHQFSPQSLSSSSSTDSQIGDMIKQKAVASTKFVRFLDAEVPSSTDSSVDSMQQYSPEDEQSFRPPLGRSTKSFHGTRSSSAAMTRNALGSAAGIPVPKSCPTQTSTATKLSTSDLEKQLQQQPTLDPVMLGIMEEIALFQKELDELKTRTASANFVVGSTKDMACLKLDAESLDTFLLEIKENTESLHGDIGTLKTVMLEGFAAVEDATTQNQRSIDQNYLQLLRRKPLDPKSEAQLKEIRRLHQYVKFAVQDVNDVLDMEWEQYQEKNKKHKHLHLPEREVLFNALASHHEIINQQDKKINELINSLQNLRIYNQTSRWCVPNDKCLSDQCWNTELEMLRNVLVKTTLDTAPKLTSSSPGKVSPMKQSQLRNFLSKRQTPPVRSTAPANLSRSAFLSPKCFEELEDANQTISALPRPEMPGNQTEELEETPFRHSPVARRPSFPPALITAQSTPFAKVQLGVNAVPKPTGKMVKQGVPVPEKPVTSVPAAQAAAQAAVRRQMTNLTAVPSASLTEAALKNVPQVINVQVLKETNQPPNLPAIISPSTPASNAEIIHQDLTKVPSDQIKPGSQINGMKGSGIGPSENGLTQSEPSSSAKSFTFAAPTAGQVQSLLKSENIVAGAPGPQVQKISSFPGASSGFHFTSPSTSSLNALNDNTLGTTGITKETFHTNSGVIKPAFGQGADVPFSFGSTKTIPSSTAASESTSGSSVSTYSDQAPDGQHVIGTPTEPSPGTPSQTEAQQSRSEHQPSKPGTRSSMIEFQAPKVQPSQQPPPKLEMVQQQLPTPPNPETEQQQPLPKPEAAQQQQLPPPKPEVQIQQQPPPSFRPEVAQQQPPSKPEAQGQQQPLSKPEAQLQQQPPPKPEVVLQPKPEVAQQPQPPKPENNFFQGSTAGVTIGNFSGLVVNQTDEAPKLDKSPQGSFTFAQTPKTSVVPPATLPFGNTFPLAKLDSTEVTTAVSVDTTSSMQSGALFSSIPLTSAESSSLRGSLASSSSKSSSVSKPSSAMQSASISPAGSVQGLSFTGSLGSLAADTAIVSDVSRLPTLEERKEIGGSSLSISSSSEKPTVEPKSSAADTPINTGTTSPPSSVVTPPAPVTSSSATPSIASSGVVASGELAVSTESNQNQVSTASVAPSTVSSHSTATSVSGSSGTSVGTSAAMPPQLGAPSQPSLASLLVSPHDNSSAPVSVFSQVENKDASSEQMFGQQTSASSLAIVVPSKSISTDSPFDGNNLAGSFAKPTFGFGQPASPSSAGFGFRQPTFGSPSVFGQPTSAALPVLSGRPFSGPANTTPFSFGHPAASSGAMFGQSNAPTFGQNASYGQAHSFGSNTPSNLAPGFSFPSSGFGGSSPGTVFGQPANTGSIFGQGSKGAAFGSPVGASGFFSGLGGKPSQDAAAKNPFGQLNFGTVDAPSTPNLFGNSGAKAFGYSSASFGADQKSPGSFSAGSSVASQGFGSFSSPTKPAGSFGAAPVFGSPPAFGGAPTFGGSPAFGGAPAFSSSIGSSGGKVFGEGTAAASAGGFGFGSNPNAQTFGSIANQSNAATFGSVSQQGSGFGTQGTSFSGFGSSGGGFGSGFGSTNQ